MPRTKKASQLLYYRETTVEVVLVLNKSPFAMSSVIHQQPVGRTSKRPGRLKSQQCGYTSPADVL